MTCIQSRVVCAMMLLPTLCWSSAQAEDWLQWRGPQFNGSTSETGFPETWTTTENVAWMVDVPGAGRATPIISGDRVFVSVQDENMELYAMCLSRITGGTVWQHPMGQGYICRHYNTGSSSSPVTDGENVFFLFGTGKLAAFTVAGTALWDMDITERYGAYEILWKYGSSPLLYQGKLYIQVIHGDQSSSDPDKSYLLAIDPNTGGILWKVDRYTPATGEGKQAYTTPLLWGGPKGSQLLITGGNHITGHDLATGKELWRSVTYNPPNKCGRTVSSPVTIDNRVFVAAPRHMKMYAAHIPNMPTDTPVPWAWTHSTNSPDVCTALVYHDKFFILDGDKKVLLCLDPKTGTILGQCKLGGSAPFWASPTAADGKIYTLNKKGEVIILSAEDTPRILHRVDMGSDNLGATIALSQRQLFIRLEDKLYCIGQNKTVKQ